MSFDFDHAVAAPFRMQPGLRRLEPGAPQFTPARPGSRPMREKLAVLSAFADEALLAVPGFEAAPLLDAACRQAASEHPDDWRWDGTRAVAPRLGLAVDVEGGVEELASGSFGLGDELGRCLRGLAPGWRLAGLLALAFEEDLAGLEADGRVPWLAVALPSHWAPADKVGRRFAEVHGPVADNRLVVAAAEALVRTVTGAERWERFVWTVTPHPRLHAHPRRVDPGRWRPAPADLPALAWFRSERQTFRPLAAPDGERQALFTIRVAVQPLAEAVAAPGRARALHDAIASMSEAVLDYRNLRHARGPLLDWLARQAAA